MFSGLWNLNKKNNNKVGLPSDVKKKKFVLDQILL